MKATSLRHDGGLQRDNRRAAEVPSTPGVVSQQVVRLPGWLSQNAFSIPVA